MALPAAKHDNARRTPGKRAVESSAIAQHRQEFTVSCGKGHKGVGVITTPAELRGFKIFDELNDRELEQIAKITKTETLEPGARLTEIGCPCLVGRYLIKEGSVTIFVDGADGKELPVDARGAAAT